MTSPFVLLVLERHLRVGGEARYVYRLFDFV